MREKKNPNRQINVLSVFFGTERLLKRMVKGYFVTIEDCEALKFLAFILETDFVKINKKAENAKIVSRIKYFFDLTFSAEHDWLPGKSYEEKIKAIIAEIKATASTYERHDPDQKTIGILLEVVSDMVDDIVENPGNSTKKMAGTDKLLGALEDHKAILQNFNGGQALNVKEVKMLAPGILAVCETDGEHTIYFDKSLVEMKDFVDEEWDIATKISGFPEGIGLIEDVLARDWERIQSTADLLLQTKKGKAIKWDKNY
jgi:hypothetical protein